MADQLTLRAGFELELLAPRGSSRRALAEALARTSGGTVRSVWHIDSEPSPVAALGGRFLHLTQGFEVHGADGALLATMVDDITITADLDAAAAAPTGWHRILTDEIRLLRLIARHSDPAGPLDQALAAMAELYGEELEQIGTIWRLDSAGATVALALPAGGERERPCEIVTPPLATDHHAALDALLIPARELGFVVPAEAAVHIHVDGGPFRAARPLANLIRLFGWWREPLRDLLGTNPNCRRLAPLPEQLVAAAAVESPSLESMHAAAVEGQLSKFFDVNLTQILLGEQVRDTVEIRILPGSIDADDVIARAAMVERLMLRCLDPALLPPPSEDPARARAELEHLMGPPGA